MTQDELLARESIRHTIASYTMAGDRLQVDRFAAVFTEEAVLETDGVPPPDAFRYEGRGAIAGWLGRWRERASAATQGVHEATFVRHHLATCHIELLDADTARGRTYWTAWTDIGPDHCGYYLDSFRRCGGHWLIAHRRIRLDWRAANSLMYTAVARSS